MASLWEPPALLVLAVVLAGGAGAIYHALRPALKGSPPVVTDERDEVWGVDDPPPPPKKPYVYPADRPEATVVAQTDREPEPLAVMPHGPTVAPLVVPTPVRAELVEAHGLRGSDALGTGPSTSSGRTDRNAEPTDEDDEEELSLADLFRPKRRSQAAPNDAPTQD